MARSWREVGNGLLVPELLCERARGWGGAEGAEWLERLPATVAGLVHRWQLVLGEPLEAHVSYVATVQTPTGEAVLKILMAGDTPYLAGRTPFDEPEALTVWDGNGAIRLLDFDATNHAMLLERCRPGFRLGDSDAVSLDEADDVAAGLFERLWCPPPTTASFTSTSVFAGEIADHIATTYEQTGAAIEPALVDDTLAALTELQSAPVSPVLVHGDLHHNNILAATRQEWLAIDPLPRAGDPCLDAVMFLLFRKGSTPDPERTWGDDIDRFCRRLGLDGGRVKQWLLARLAADGLSALAAGTPVEELESYQEDFWSARLVRRFL